jgi:phage tail protein X
MRFSDRVEARAFVEDNSQTVYTITTNPYTMVQVQCVINGQVYEAVGFAKYNPNDQLPTVTKKQMPDPVQRAAYYRRRDKLAYNRQRGIDIAYGRAINSIVDTLANPGMAARAKAMDFGTGVTL